MKRKAVWLVVPVALGFMAYGIKYRLDHPPLSQADKAFRQMVQSSDEITVVYVRYSANNYSADNGNRKVQVLARLQQPQFGELQDVARLLDKPGLKNLILGGYGLRFYRCKKFLGGINVTFGQNNAGINSWLKGKDNFHGKWLSGKDIPVHPRFVRRLESYLALQSPEIERKRMTYSLYDYDQ